MVLQELLDGKNGEKFFEELQSTVMLKITFDDREIEAPRFINIPKVLACAVSSHFRHLCSSGRLRLTIDEVMSKGAGRCFYLLREVTCTPYRGLILVFVKWLYTSKLECSDFHTYDIWRFAEHLGSAKFQNAALFNFAVDDAWNDFETGLCADFDTIQDAWEATDFSQDGNITNTDCELEINWGNKQRLSFTLDCAVYVGCSYNSNHALLHNGGPMAVEFTHRLLKAEEGEGRLYPPWHESNREKYLIDDKITDL